MPAFTGRFSTGLPIGHLCPVRGRFCGFHTFTPQLWKNARSWVYITPEEISGVSRLRHTPGGSQESHLRAHTQKKKAASPDRLSTHRPAHALAHPWPQSHAHPGVALTSMRKSILSRIDTLTALCITSTFSHYICAHCSSSPCRPRYASLYNSLCTI